MRATFMPTEEDQAIWADMFAVDPELNFIKVLIIDESGPGCEIRIYANGMVQSLMLGRGIEHYRSSPLWVEVNDAA
jgi:energy-converting hydrogenase Eha subunit B